MIAIIGLPIAYVVTVIIVFFITSAASVPQMEMYRIP